MASNTDTHRETIEAHVEAAAILPMHRTDWGGMVDFDPPDGESWMRVNVLYGDAFEEVMSDGDGPQNRVYGVLEVQIFGVPGEGFGPLFRLADQVRDLVNGEDLDGGIEFRAPSAPRRVGNRDGWLQVNVTAPFSVPERV